MFRLDTSPPLFILHVIVIFLAALVSVSATPLQPTVSSCLGLYNAAAASNQLVVNSAYANIVAGVRAKELGLAGDGHDVLRVDLLGTVGAEVIGYDNSTNKLATLFADTSTAHISVYSSTTWLCNSLFPATLPSPYYPYNTTYCPLPAGDFALNISIPLYRSYALTTLRTQIRIVDTSLSAATLACYNLEFTPYRHSGWYYSLFLWLPVAVAIAFWIITWSARFAAGWVVGSGVAEYETKEGAHHKVENTRAGRREARMRKWGTMFISGLSGERLSVSSALLRFVTPGLRDVIHHIQFCTILGMIAVSWPRFAYPILAQGAWADLVWNTTLVQGSDAASKRLSDYPSNYTAPAAFANMMNDPYYPLYLDPNSFNPLIDLHRSSKGIDAFATAVGLRNEDLFGTCIVVFLAITLGVTFVSLLLWFSHGFIEYLAIPRRSAQAPNRVSTHSPQASLGGKEVYEPRSYGWDQDGTALPTQGSLAAAAAAQRSAASAPSRFRRTWFRFRLKGEAGAFHAAALYGNLLRLILMFHLPITAFSVYQLSLSEAAIVSRVFAAIAFVLISVLIPAGILFKVKRTPSGKLYDATRTLLSLGPMYNVYVENKQMFRVVPLSASLIEGIVIGGGQKSGITQAIIFVLVELAMLILPAVWYPWGEGASMGAPSAFLGIIRVASALLVMLLAPTLTIPASTRDWLAYAVLLLQAIAFVFFILMLLVKLVEGLIRLFGGAHFDESTSPLDGGLFAAIMDLDCLNGVRGGKAAQRKRRKRGSRQLQRNVSAAGSLTTQMMLDRHSQGVPRQPVSEGSTPFLQSYAQFGDPNQNAYFPGYQPPLGPPPLERHSSESRSDEPSASGHIMDAWKPSQPLGYHHPAGAAAGGYALTATSPSHEAGPSSSFAVIRGGRADYQNPYEVKEGTLATSAPRALSPPPARTASPSKPAHHRTRSSTAIIEAAYSSPPPSPSVAQGAVPTLYPPGHDRTRPNNQGLRPPPLAIPKRRSLNNLKDDPSPDSNYSSPSNKGTKGKKAKRRSKPAVWFGGKSGDDSESSPAEEESDDEPGPSRRHRQPKPFEPIPSPLGEKEKKGWRAALGLVRKKSLDDIAEQARDENKARKAALAKESGSMFAGVDAPVPPQSPPRNSNQRASASGSGSRGFVVNRRSAQSADKIPQVVVVDGSPSKESGERSFKVKRMGQQTPSPVPAPPAPAANSTVPSTTSPIASSSHSGAASGALLAKSNQKQGKRGSTGESVKQARPPSLAQPVRSPASPKESAPPKTSFRVLGRPSGPSPVTSPTSPENSRTASGSFVVNRPKSYQATQNQSQQMTPSSSSSLLVTQPAQPAQTQGYAPDSFVPLSRGNRDSVGSASSLGNHAPGSGPGRPGKDPRRSQEYPRG